MNIKTQVDWRRVPGSPLSLVITHIKFGDIVLIMGGKSSKPPDIDNDLPDDNIAQHNHNTDPVTSKEHQEHIKSTGDIDEEDQKFAGDQIELKAFRQQHSVSGHNRKRLAMTLKGTVRARRKRIGAEVEASHD